MPIPAIEAQSLTKTYKASDPPAVEGLDFIQPAGSTWALLGGNGAGKSTTIAMLLGLLVPSGGRVVVLGHDMARDRFAALARMNFSSPYVALPHRLTVRENLTVYAHLYNVPGTHQRIAELAERLQLAGFLDRPAGQLSAGQKTRVAIAKSLINRPELLLLDEPTASLDPDTAAILLASHNMAEVERLADHVLMLKGGRIVDQGSPADLIARYGRDDLEQVFLDIARGQGRAA